MENKFELVYNEREDATELKNLPIDDNMNGIIEEEEMEEEGSDIEEDEDENHWASMDIADAIFNSNLPAYWARATSIFCMKSTPNHFSASWKDTDTLQKHRLRFPLGSTPTNYSEK